MKARMIGLAATTVAVAATAGVSAALAGAPEATYEVTIRNLTGGQPFTPPLVATHRAATDLFAVGEAASVGIQEIAENGNLDPAIAALQGDRHVSGVVHGSAPLVPSGLPGSMFGDTVTLSVTASKGARFLSFASMLICTNDGFTGVDSLKLPAQVGGQVVVHTNGYDAGTETNTEDFADIVPPCQGLVGISSGEMGTGTTDPALAEGGVVHHHPGIAWIADLVPDVHGWNDPVAEVTVTRVS